MERSQSYKSFINRLRVSLNPLDEANVSGLTIEYHDRPGLPLYSMLELTYTPSQGRIRYRPQRVADDPSWDWILETSPAFVRSQLAILERAGLWGTGASHRLTGGR